MSEDSSSNLALEEILINEKDIWERDDPFECKYFVSCKTLKFKPKLGLSVLTGKAIRMMLKKRVKRERDKDMVQSEDGLRKKDRGKR